MVELHHADHICCVVVCQFSDTSHQGLTRVLGNDTKNLLTNFSYRLKFCAFSLFFFNKICSSSVAQKYCHYFRIEISTDVFFSIFKTDKNANWSKKINHCKCTGRASNKVDR